MVLKCLVLCARSNNKHIVLTKIQSFSQMRPVAQSREPDPEFTTEGTSMIPFGSGPTVPTRSWDSLWFWWKDGLIRTLCFHLGSFVTSVTQKAPSRIVTLWFNPTMTWVIFGCGLDSGSRFWSQINLFVTKMYQIVFVWIWLEMKNKKDTWWPSTPPWPRAGTNRRWTTQREERTHRCCTFKKDKPQREERSTGNTRHENRGDTQKHTPRTWRGKWRIDQIKRIRDQKSKQ